MMSGMRPALRADVLGEVLHVQRPVGLPGWQERKQATSPRGLMACVVFDCGRDRYAFHRRK
jgi:hypothetical protein